MKGVDSQFTLHREGYRYKKGSYDGYDNEEGNGMGCGFRYGDGNGDGCCYGYGGYGNGHGQGDGYGFGDGDGKSQFMKEEENSLDFIKGEVEFTIKDNFILIKEKI